MSGNAVSYFRDGFLPMSGCKQRLLWLWLGLSGLIMLLLLIRSNTCAYYTGSCDAANAYGGRVWGWFLPNFMPTLMLMIGIVVADDTRRQKDEEDGKAARPKARASGFLFRVSFFLSVIHLSVLVFMILYQALPDDASTMLEVMEGFGYFVVPFQGLVTAVLGAFFTR